MKSQENKREEYAEGNFLVQVVFDNQYTVMSA